ncbi:hypothetical protein [Candidatus Cyanaurora vandensis]|uniref:hypothetical protein n=1 Tax=Candidatus Cyanaurora vandensis TaxID=2714958 RepID=UPI00257D61E1|nr:hypothetical protein [Candidatus Cyanaurora vandensis]
MSTTDGTNCAVTCVNGCVLGDACPHLANLATARQYIAETPWNQIMETADAYTNQSEDEFLNNPMLQQVLKATEGFNRPTPPA